MKNKFLAIIPCLNEELGIVDTIKTKRPFIICEILPNYNNEETDRFKRQLELERLLLSLDYVISRIHESESKVERLDAIGSFSSMDETNYLFIPSEKLDKLKPLLID